MAITVGSLCRAGRNPIWNQKPAMAFSIGGRVFSFAVVPEGHLLPGISTELPTFAVLALLLFPLPDRVCEFPWLRPIRCLGGRPYSAYLWH